MSTDVDGRSSQPDRYAATQIMGVLNVTPDSFSDGGEFLDPSAALHHVEEMVEQGADWIDIGAYSSRPGATDIDVQVELERLQRVLPSVVAHFPNVKVSVDTFRARVAEEVLSSGALMINDISAGRDPAMLEVVARHGAGYVAMHMQGTPQTMQNSPHYEDVVEEVRTFLRGRIAAAKSAGIEQVWGDPGFGFGKRPADNWALLRRVHDFCDLGVPILVGVSRKGMFYRPLSLTPLEVLPATSAAHLWAVLAGANMLRVHDVGAAKQAIFVASQLDSVPDQVT